MPPDKPDAVQSPANTYERLTSPGPAAIAVVRLRGPGVADFLARHVRPAGAPAQQAVPARMTLAPGALRRATLCDAQGAALDDMLVSAHAQAPHADVRLHLHGNPFLVRQCEALCEAAGFTRAVQAGRDLWPAGDALEAELHNLLPQMRTWHGVTWLLDQAAGLRRAVEALQTEPDAAHVAATCRRLARGLRRVAWFAMPWRLALVGPPNAGKSTLANALADQVVSLVSPQPGTTRDWVEAEGELAGLPVTWIDTAGLRAAEDALEAAGVDRTHAVVRGADGVIVVLDASAGQTERTDFIAAHGTLAPLAVALNKCDRGAAPGLLAELPMAWRARATYLSATTRAGLATLQTCVVATGGRGADVAGAPGAFTARQAELLRAAAGERAGSLLAQVLGGR